MEETSTVTSLAHSRGKRQPLLPLPDRLPVPGQFQSWHHLYGAGKALAIVEWEQKFSRPVLVICQDNQSLARMTAELRFFLPQDDLDACPVIGLPDRETLPYDRFSPHQDILSERIATLSHLPSLRRGIVVAALSTLMTRLPPSGYLSFLSLPLRCGQRCARNELSDLLVRAGYRAAETVFEHGDFAVRGAVLDLFPMGFSDPVRIEFFDDAIESLRHFDVDTQRSGKPLEQIALLPASECPLDAAAIVRFRQRWSELIDIDPRHCPLYQDVLQGIHSPGIEYFLPLFFEHTETVFQYLPKEALIVSEDDLLPPFRHYSAEIAQRYAEVGHDIYHPILPPALVFIPEEEFFRQLNVFARLRIVSGAVQGSGFDFAQHAPLTLSSERRQQEVIEILAQHMRNYPERRFLLQAETPGHREALREQLIRAQYAVTDCDHWTQFLEDSCALGLTLGELECGFATATLEVISEVQLYGTKVMQRRRRRRSNAEFHDEMALRSLVDMTPGCPMVHIDHGVGRYQGLVTLEVDGQMQEFLLLTYAEAARLYVPVRHLHLVARYAGHDVQQAPLHRLGSGQWEKARKQAVEKIHDIAAELLDIHARRAARPGNSCAVDTLDYARFTAGFPFEETADQTAAIEAVLQDMRRPQPMDRLVCGDVGFGKTEVAMRAAFVAVHNEFQVAVLVPTTLLAQQHFETFRDRFADWPVHIDVLSRFRSQKEIQLALRSLAEGKTDILIGTHKLLQSDIRFSRLGLMIVDEEHRFGVKHKEKLKNLRAEVDMLTLTATPIPRTLNMALSGLRDLSIIATPPLRRLAIRTFVRPYQTGLIKEAVMRELLRGGQVYYLHNEVDTIESCQLQLARLLPEARIAVAHGQMRERELEQVMQQFYHKQTNLLVCTTIIETGIDIPSANTIIIERADHLGMAQLHQLRGRVGRSHHQAYAYLLTPEDGKITVDAQKRLDALAMAQDLGSGFVLASQDLEIRGAGELLGSEQSGSMEAIGYSLYMDLLDRAVTAIQQGQVPQTDQTADWHGDINLRIPALIPETYLPDVQLRLLFYKRIASTRDVPALHELKVEMIDRFGLLPTAVVHLFSVQQLRLRAQQLGISRIEIHAQGGSLEFAAQTRVDPGKLIRLIQQSPQQFKMEGSSKLRVIREMGLAEQRLSWVETLLGQLALS